MALQLSGGLLSGAAMAAAGDSGTAFVSWYRDVREDDLGRSAVQHKPLNKGVHAQASLAKSFHDTEPSMAPRTLIPAHVNKPHTPLSIDDIQGTRSRPKNIIQNPRGTDPQAPVYQLATATQPANAAEPTPRFSGRETNYVRDIEGAVPKPVKQNGPKVQDLCLDISDIDGASTTWKPQYRALANGVPTDKRFETTDVNTIRFKKILERRLDDPWLMTDDTLIANRRPRPRPHSAHPRIMSAAPAQTGAASTATGLGTTRPPVEYTGLPYFQDRGAEYETDATHTLRPDQGCQDQTSNEYAVVGELLQEQQQELSRVNATVARARRKQQLLETDIAHDLRLGISHESREARQAASEAIQAMQISRAQVEALWDALRGSDRESSGKVTVSELTKAFRTAGVQVGSGSMQALVRGLRDGVGLIGYNDLAKTLLWKSKQQQQQLQASGASRPLRPFSAAPASRRPSQLAAASAAVPAPAAAQHVGHLPHETPVAPAPIQHNNTQAPTQAAPYAGTQEHGMQQPAYSIPTAITATTTDQQSATAQPQLDTGSTGQQPNDAAPSQSRPRTPPHTHSHTHGSASNGLPPGAVLMGPEGARYYTYKGWTYWFGGNDTPAELAFAAAAYKACEDQSHSVTVRYARKGLGDGGPLGAGLAGNMGPVDPACIRDMPTTAALLKNGVLRPEELARQLDLKHTRPAATESTMRTTKPADAAAAAAATASTARSCTTQRPMSAVPAARSGASVGAALRAVVGGTTSAAFTALSAIATGDVAARAAASAMTAAKPRPLSAVARPVGRVAAVGPSFTAIANAGPGAVMQKHDCAALRDEIRNVRQLG